MRQQSQVRTGTELLLTAIAIAYALQLAGGIFLIEHPAPLPTHDVKEAASIWRLGVTQALAFHGDAAFHVVDQGCFGAPSRKPTGLLANRLPTLAMRLLEHGNLAVPKTASIGLDADGNFMTAVLKEYPSQLCRAFAHAALDSCQGEGLSWGQPPCENLGKFVQNVMPHDIYWSMGEDFWG